MTTINVIPDTALLEIFSFLLVGDLKPARQVCKKWNVKSNDNFLWKKYCERRFMVDSERTIEDEYGFDPKSKDWRKLYLHRLGELKRTNCNKAKGDYFVGEYNELKGPYQYFRFALSQGFYVSQGREGVCSVSDMKPFPYGSFPFVYYFEAALVQSGDPQGVLTGGQIGDWCVGLTPTDQSEKQAMPGWGAGYGFRSDGCLHHNSPQGTIWSDSWHLGDTIGCLVNMFTKEVCYTRDGVLLPGPAFQNVEVKNFKPKIGLGCEGQIIKVNFGTAPFLFDVAEYVRRCLKEYQRDGRYTLLSQVMKDTCSWENFVDIVQKSYHKATTTKINKLKPILCKGGNVPHFQEFFTWFPLRKWSYLFGEIVKNFSPEWFHGFISSDQAQELLQNQPNGTYLFRFSTTVKSYALSVAYNSRVHHWRITVDSDAGLFHLGKEAHIKLSDLIDYHTSHPLVGTGGASITLVAPLNRKSEENQINQ